MCNFCIIFLCLISQAFAIKLPPSEQYRTPVTINQHKSPGDNELIVPSMFGSIQLVSKNITYHCQLNPKERKWNLIKIKYISVNSNARFWAFITCGLISWFTATINNWGTPAPDTGLQTDQDSILWPGAGWSNVLQDQGSFPHFQFKLADV